MMKKMVVQCVIDYVMREVKIMFLNFVLEILQIKHVIMEHEHVKIIYVKPIVHIVG